MRTRGEKARLCFSFEETPRENCHGAGNDADDGAAAQIPGELPRARRGLVQRLAPHPADLHHRLHRAVRWIVANFDNEWEMTSADIDAANRRAAARVCRLARLPKAF